MQSWSEVPGKNHLEGKMLGERVSKVPGLGSLCLPPSSSFAAQYAVAQQAVQRDGPASGGSAR
jgi:hypothetical protein